MTNNTQQLLTTSFTARNNSSYGVGNSHPQINVGQGVITNGSVEDYLPRGSPAENKGTIEGEDDK